MSSRYYPRWVKGCPQMRVFLPDFWMVMIKPHDPVPDNEVHFKVPARMTKWDIRNYLEKIYNIPVAGVVSYVRCGRIHLPPNEAYLSKDDDWRMVVVTLKHPNKFTWPDLFKNTKVDEEMKDLKAIDHKAKQYQIDQMKGKVPRPGVPSWFGI